MTGQQAWPIDNIERRSDGNYRVTFDGGLGMFASADELAAAGITPPADPINFDTLPVGTTAEVNVLGDVFVAVKLDYGWYIGDDSTVNMDDADRNARLLHVPAPPSLLDALHTLGLTDHDIDRLTNGSATPWGDIIVKVADAAREAQAQR